MFPDRLALARFVIHPLSQALPPRPHLPEVACQHEPEQQEAEKEEEERGVEPDCDAGDAEAGRGR
jgi:hypothetical protein